MLELSDQKLSSEIVNRLRQSAQNISHLQMECKDTGLCPHGITSPVGSEKVHRNHVVVTVHNGYAILDGTVRWPCERESIGWIVRGVPKVIGVSNRIDLDEKIAE